MKPDKDKIIKSILGCLEGDFASTSGMEMDDDAIVTFNPENGTIMWWPKGKPVLMKVVLEEERPKQTPHACLTAVKDCPHKRRFGREYTRKDGGVGPNVCVKCESFIEESE
jgi:hypothetical protein